MQKLLFSVGGGSKKFEDWGGGGGKGWGGGGGGGVTNLEGLLLLGGQYTITCYVYANMQITHQKVPGTTFKRSTLHGTIK